MHVEGNLAKANRKLAQVSAEQDADRDVAALAI